MRWWCVPLLLASLTGCVQPASVAAPGPVPFASAEHGFSAALPGGWHVAPASLTPHLANPVEILSAGTMDGLRPRDGACGHVAVGAIERMGPRDAFVTVQERFGETMFPARPARFALADPQERSDATACAEGEPPLDVYWWEFRDAGRNFHVLVALGREAPRERRVEALALLDSLRFEPGPDGVRLDPDRTVYARDVAAELSWAMPVPPWRRYDRALTSVVGERLVLGTFPLARRAPDENCTPRAAIDALPSDGAFIYVFEYVAADAFARVPERSGELALGPPVAYECLGESRMVRWRDHGRVLQAHVYLGSRAGEALLGEARSIINSIRAY